MVELDSVTVRGFKSIASIQDLKLGSVNVLIGANGSGKSNFVGVFSFLQAVREGRLQDYVVKAGGAEKLLYFGSRVTKEIVIHISFRGGLNRYEIELQPTETDQLVPHRENVYYWNKARYPEKPHSQPLLPLGKEAGISDEKATRIPRYVRDHLAGWRLYHFHDTSAGSPMKKIADTHDNRYLRPDGANLAPFLYFIREKHEISYGLIRRTIQQVATFFDDFLLAPLELNPDKIRLEWRHKGSEAYFDASSLSDGTLRFMALATLFLQPESYRPPVIMIDEPELGLHPYAITIFASLVKQAAVKTQVILSTQSSLLLDHFQAEDVIVAERVDEGTQFTRLDPEKLGTWLEDYSLGQLWEKNELGGRPGGIATACPGC